MPEINGAVDTTELQALLEAAGEHEAAVKVAEVPEFGTMEWMLWLKSINQTRIQILNMQGMSITPDSFTSMFVKAAVEVLCGNDEQLKLDIDVTFQQNLSAMLDEAEQQLRQAQLTAGVEEQANGLHIPGRG